MKKKGIPPPPPRRPPNPLLFNLQILSKNLLVHNLLSTISTLTIHRFLS